MPPRKRKSKHFLSLDRHKTKRKSDNPSECQSNEVEDGLPMPLFHSTPIKHDSANVCCSSTETQMTTTEESVLETAHRAADKSQENLVCSSCKTSIKKPDIWNTSDDVYGILCSYCGAVTRAETPTTENACHHSLLIAYDMCDQCGSFRKTDISHTHSILSRGEVCDKCGFGVPSLSVKACKGDCSVSEDATSLPVTEQSEVFASSSRPSETTDSGNAEPNHTHSSVKSGVHANPSTITDEETGFSGIDTLDTLVRKCMSILVDTDMENILVELLLCITNGSLSPDSLTYHIFLDTLKALNAVSLTEMRFSYKNKVFWKTFINKFGAAPIRFLSGWKHAGALLLGKGGKGNFSGDEADIILAIPNEDVLKAFDPYDGEWPRSIPPGICTNIVSKLAAAHQDTSICISLDGKKVAPGLKGDKGDINLLGREGDINSVSPAVQKQLNMEEINYVNCIKNLVCNSTESLIENIDTCTILERLRNLLKILTDKKAETRNLLEKKSYALEKLKARATAEPSSAKYQYPVSLVTANIVELKELNAIGDKLKESIASMCAALVMNPFQWVTIQAVNIGDCGRYHALHDIDLFIGSSEEPLKKFAQHIINQGLPYIKQRSSLWFQARNEVRVTASTLFNAVGCAGLKAQREHYQHTVLGFERPAPDNTVQEAMDWGTKHEICSLATLATKFVPALYPDCCLLEVGAFHIQVGNVAMVISPDGFLHCNTSQEDIAAVECKCPKSGKVPNAIQPRYYLQVQAHIRSKPGIEWCLFCVWTDETTKAFRVERDPEIWPLVQKEVNDIYGGDVTRCPTRLSDTSKAIKEMIRVNIPKYCQVVAELPSVHACCFEDEVITVSAENPDPYTTSVTHDSCLSRDPPNIQELPLSQLGETLDEVKYYLKQHHQLSRKKATEVVAFVACNTDRLWSAELTHGTPICYFLKGYSLATSVVRNILEDVLDYCHSKGIHCPVQSFDGQYLPLLQTSKDGHPQTLLELQKIFWKEVCKMTKQQMVTDMKVMNAITTLDDVLKKTVTSAGVVTVTLAYPNVQLPKTAVASLKTASNTDGSLQSQAAGNQVIRQIMEELPESVISLELDSVIDQDNHHTDQQNQALFDINCDNFSIEESESTAQENDNNSTFDGGEDCETAEHSTFARTASDIDTTSTGYSNILDADDMNNILALLKDQTPKWNDKNINDLEQQLQNCQSLSKLTITELKVLMKYLKDFKHHNILMSGRKNILISTLKNILHLPGDVTAPTGYKSPSKLSVMCVKLLNSRVYPKQALAISYANWKFPERVCKWRNTSKIKHNMVIPELDDKTGIDWFYIPEYSADRGELMVRKIDPHHLLTRHRSALCKRDIGQARRRDFLEVAADNTTSLKLGLLEESLDMQNTDFALITFSKDVQDELAKKGHNSSARFCQLVRDWFHSMDEPGIPSVERFKMKLRYRESLLSMVDMYSFPPPRMYVKGYPKALWESTISSIDADLILCGLVKRRTYNQRAISSQMCESLFGSLSSLSSSRNGVPNCVDLETNFAKICGEMVVRYDPNRGFPVRLSSATVYPQQQLEVDSGPLPQPMPPPAFISEITLHDHPFDKPARKRTARRKLQGLTNLHEPARGVTGVRVFHRVNEGRLNALIRLGKSGKTE